jgi:hypothetical protein
MSTVKKEAVLSTEDVSELKDEESGVFARESINRPVILISATYVGLAMALLVFILYGFSMAEVSFTSPQDKMIEFLSWLTQRTIRCYKIVY